MVQRRGRQEAPPQTVRSGSTRTNSVSRRFLGATGRFIVEVGKVVLVALAIIVPIRMFVVQPFSVSGSSMEDSFFHRDYLVIDEISYRFRAPERGEVIVFRFPEDRSQFFIKRIIGLPGETIRVRDGRVFVVTSEIQYLLDEADYLPVETITTGGDQEVVLGEDEYYVLGDNRTASSDSRVWGSLTTDDIVGRAWIRAWPFASANIVDAPNFQLLDPIPEAQ